MKTKTSYKTKDIESYQYYKTAYRANKRYRDKKGEESPLMMSKSDWEYAKNVGLSNQDIVYNQFHKYERKTVQALRTQLEAYGEKTSYKKLQAGDINWKILQERFDELKKTMNSSEAKKTISYEFFGSE